LHEELRNLVESGLSRFQALSTATRNAGAFVARTRPEAPPFGTIEAGRRADLVLTLANPLDALETLRRPVGVMTYGRWFDASALVSLVDERKQRYQRLEELRWTDPKKKRLPKSPP
jgi:imidazolonepropionase-like amidohydrolase